LIALDGENVVPVEAGLNDANGSGGEREDMRPNATEPAVQGE